jgi:hypothetical protein
MLLDFRQSGKRVYLVLEIARGSAFDLRKMINRHFDVRNMRFEFKLAGGGIALADLPPEREYIAARLTEVARTAGAEVIDPCQFLCPSGICPTVTENGRPIYRDAGHLGASFVREHADFLDRTLAKH